MSIVTCQEAYTSYAMKQQAGRGFGKLVGGSLCLDFVNTVGGRVGGSRSGTRRDYGDRIVDERLTSYDALLRWAVLGGVLTSGEARALADDASSRPGEAFAVLERSLTLREAMYRVFKAAVEGWRPRSRDLIALNAELRAARTHERLVAAPHPAWAWGDDRGALDRMLWPVVKSAAGLLTGSALGRVGQCPGDRCGWLFLDTSRSRRRQWCDMGECGNLAKVRRFRDRQRRERPARRSRPSGHV